MKKIIFIIFSLISLLCSCSNDDQNSDPKEVVPLKFLYSTPADKTSNVMLDQEVAVIYNSVIAVNDGSGITVNGQKAEVSVSERKLLFKIDLAKNITYEVKIAEGAIKNTTGSSSPATSFSFSTVADVQRSEAELATLSGNAVVENTLAGYSGTGYVNMKEGDAVFKVVMAEGGLYKINIRYWGNNGDKENDLEVNGVKLATVKFGGTQNWSNVYINKVSLNTGENTIAIRKNWGWINVDYIDIENVSEDVSFNISPNLVTPNPSKEAVNVYNFLKENFGKKIISGAMANYSTGLEEAKWMYDNVGKWPALTGFDYINYTRDWSSINFTELTNNAKDYWNNNGLITLMWHWRDPLKNTDGFYTKDTSFDVSKVTDTNSNEYKAMVADIDVIASYLKQLKDANVPVLWRPLHEASGAWFWWGAKGAEPCRALWKLMYDRLVNHHGLNNLIWVWTTEASNDAINWYPGDNYVDILGLDIYPGENQHGSQYITFDKVKEIFGGKKMITLSECGSIPNIDAMFEYGDAWSWFMPWNGDYTRSDKHNGTTFLKNVFSNAKVLTRDGMPSLK